MSVKFYMDVHIPRPVTAQLRRAGVIVLTAQEDGHAEVDDNILLDRASALGYVLVTQDKGLLAETARRQRMEVPFEGLICSHAEDIQVGPFIADLRIVASATEPAEWLNRVEYLPL